MSAFNYQITKSVGVLSSSGDYTKEVNIISYNGADPVLDIRKWDRKADRMQKGITLNKDELEKLRELLSEVEL